MTADAATSPADLLDALRRGDTSAAARLIDGNRFPPDQLQSLADGLMRRRRWADAAWVFSQISPRSAAVDMKRCLSRNLASMQRNRLDVYNLLVSLGATASFGVAASPSGRPTILARRPDDSAVSLSGGADPLAAAGDALAGVRRVTPNGESVALCGVGDGYLLQLLAQHPPALFMDTQQAVFVLEPEPQVLLHALMIHDCAGDDDDNGPIAAERFRWFIGPDWHERLDAAVEAEPAIGLPVVMLQQGLRGKEIQAHVEAGISKLVERDAVAKAEIEAYYAGLSPSMLSAIMGPNPPRAPRVMFLTTRFSTVLQYSTRDTAEAFRELGWDARVVIEPGPSHRLYQHTIRAAVAEFRPDVVFQIDHLRHEHRDLFPPGLPFVCWIQDHLHNLKSPRAAASVTANDYILTDAAAVYATTFGYPERQLIGLNKLTRVPSTPPAAEPQDGDDIVFVSSASHVPETILAARAAEYDGSGAGRALLTAAGARLIDVYCDGGCVPTWIELQDLVRIIRAERGFDVPTAELDALAAWLFHPFNDALYRQQALGWAADVAGELGLTLALYGKGWERHPRFAPYARGPVAYGPDLDRLTRRSRINLQIVPYLCLHQRLLDGLVAGGFYLIRQHPADTEVSPLLDFVDAHVGADVRDASAVLAALPEARVDEFRQLVAAARPALATSDADDPVRLARQWREIGLIRAGDTVLPDFPATSFIDAGSLKERVRHFIGDAPARNAIRARQRGSVVERFSYVSGIRRVMGQVRRLIEGNARSDERRLKEAA